jgi:hypothetical protein
VPTKLTQATKPWNILNNRLYVSSGIIPTKAMQTEENIETPVASLRIPSLILTNSLSREIKKGMLSEPATTKLMLNNDFASPLPSELTGLSTGLYPGVKKTAIIRRIEAINTPKRPNNTSIFCSIFAANLIPL